MPDLPTPAEPAPTVAEPEAPAASLPPQVEPQPTPEPVAPAPKKAAPVVKVAKRKSRAAQASAPVVEVEARSVPGNLFAMPYDFDIHSRVTASAERFTEGVSLQFRVRSSQDCRIFLIAHDCDNGAVLLLPGEKDTATLVFSSVEGKFPGAGRKDYDLIVEPPFGRDIITLLALGSTAKCDVVREFEDYIAKHQDQHVGELENGLIAHFREKHSKMADLPWASAVLHMDTYPGQQQSTPPAV